MESQNQNSNSEQQTINIQVPSSDNIASRRSLAPASFALAIIFFFFTFCDFKCFGQKIDSVTGINLVTGTEIKGRDMMSGEESKGEKIPANVWAILAFSAGIIGLGAFLIKEKRESLIGTGAGAIGFSALLILQFVIKSTIDEKGEGQIETNFQFGYWGALLAMALAGLISYLRLKQTYKVVVHFSPPQTTAPTILPSEMATSQPVQTSLTTQSGGSFDLVEWIGRNRKRVIGVLVAAAFLFGGYYFYLTYLMHDPERDGKKVASAYCNCIEKDNGAKIKVYAEFLKSFTSYNFKNQQEARSKLSPLVNQINRVRFECDEKAMSDAVVIRNRYLTNDADLKNLESAANAHPCNPSNQRNVQLLYSEVEGKISSIGRIDIPLQSQ